MYKDKKVIIQTILFAYPDICMDKKQREERFVAVASGRSGDDSVRVQGGQPLSAQDKFTDLMERDQQLQKANVIISALQRGFQKMAKSDYLTIREFFFERSGRSGTASAMNMSESNVDKKIDRGFCALQDSCCEVYHIFCQWRRVRDKERLESSVIDINNNK